MKQSILCRPEKDFSNLSFYLMEGERMYFLFSQKYSFKTLNYFKNGIDLERALSFKCAKSMKSRSVMKVTEKLIPYIKYIEKEEHIVVLKQTMQSKYISRWKKSDSEKELQFDFF